MLLDIWHRSSEVQDGLRRTPDLDKDHLSRYNRGQWLALASISGRHLPVLAQIQRCLRNTCQAKKAYVHRKKAYVTLIQSCLVVNHLFKSFHLSHQSTFICLLIQSTVIVYPFICTHIFHLSISACPNTCQETR